MGLRPYSWLHRREYTVYPVGAFFQGGNEHVNNRSQVPPVKTWGLAAGVTSARLCKSRT